jgi:ATP synthase protein I
MSANGKDHPSGDGRISPEDRDAIRRRSAEIGKKLDALEKRRAPVGGPAAKSPQSAYGPAFKFAAELVVGVVVGGGLGWVLDRRLGTAPWLMVAFFIIGFAAGLLNVIRSAREAQEQNEPLQKAAPSVIDDDDE